MDVIAEMNWAILSNAETVDGSGKEFGGTVTGRAVAKTQTAAHQALEAPKASTQSVSCGY